MATRYLETRSLQKISATLAADIARHIQLRQRLGNAVIVCENPHALLSATRKQWLRLSRQLQIKRAATLNTEEILRLTHIIVHMQKMTFVAKTPEIKPDAHIYYVTPEELRELPLQCFTLYLTTDLFRPVDTLMSMLAKSALVVDYTEKLDTYSTELDPKHYLEIHLLEKWHIMEELLTSHGLPTQALIGEDPALLPILDTAIDSLLEISSQFLTAAYELQYAADLAQPLTTISPEKQKTFLLVTRLAYKVQTLSRRSSQNPIIADSYFLRDCKSEENDMLFSPLSAFRTPQLSSQLLY